MTTLRETGEQIFREALDTCTIAHAFQSKMLVVSSDVLRLEGEGEVDLSGVERVLIVAMGKGAASMLDALLAFPAVTEGREVKGILIAPLRPVDLHQAIAFYAGGHPSPNEQSMAAARAALEVLQTAAQSADAGKTFCFFLISGGASAMMELPLDASITLEDTILFHRALVHSGASIAEINCVRKHFSAVKGGRLALAAGRLRNLTIAVSDVPSGQLDVLASGPTLPDSSTIDECRAIIARYDLLSRFPESVRRFFDSAQLVESPKPGEVEARVYPLLSSDDLEAAAKASAERRGFRVFIDNTCDDWDYQAAADYLLERMRALKREYGRVCLISAGEVTVTVPSSAATAGREPGVGGRNLHFALYSALQLQASDGIAIVSAGSDGVDGNSPAAGAVVDGSIVEGREDAARRALDAFDSFHFLDGVGAAIVTGPTGNNLRDLRVMLS